MAITIRNKKTEELIRSIGRRTGEGPSAIVRRMAEKEAGIDRTPAPEEVARRVKLLEDLRREFQAPEPRMTWADVEREMDSLFDYLEDGSDKMPRAS